MIKGVNFGFSNYHFASLIKLLDSSYLELNKKNITITVHEGNFITIHTPSKAHGIGISKEESFKNIISSKEFTTWYNLKIAQQMGFEIKIEEWLKITKLMTFQIEYKNKWVDINKEYFLACLLDIE